MLTIAAMPSTSCVQRLSARPAAAAASAGRATATGAEADDSRSSAGCRSMQEASRGSLEPVPVDAVVADLVVEDPPRGAEQARRHRAVAAGLFERVLQRVLLHGFHHLLE